MRLLPNRMRVSIVERTPVAFVRQGGHIGLVDANGVLLDMPVDAKTGEHYSFPVVTGILANDPQSTRAARMKIFERFTSELDGSGEKISQELSEVDLSDLEDVKALIPDHSAEVLVHFGDEDFLNRYKRFKEHLTEWRTVYPRLSSVDMRYERQVVLEMQPGAAVPIAPSAGAVASPAADASGMNAKAPAAADVDKAVKKPSVKHAVAPGAKSGVKSNEKAAAKTVAKKPTAVTTHGVATKPPVHVVAQSEVAFDVPSKKTDPKKTQAATKPHAGVTKPAAAATQNHSTQVVHP
jgi:cell division protein FtsQ